VNQPAEKTGYTVTFSGVKDYPEETMRRARAMLEALLDESVAPKGSYLFSVNDVYPPFEKLVTARLEVERGSIQTAVLVRLRSRGGNGGSIVGSLYLPPEANRLALAKDMEITADNFNRGGSWVAILQNLPPNAFPRRSVEGPPPQLAILGEKAPQGKLTPDVQKLSVPSAPAQQAHIALVQKPANRNEESVMTTTDRSVMVAKLTEFLKAVAREVADSNGVFPSQGIARHSKPFFPSQEPRWLGQGILFELEHLKWIHHVVGKGQYQIDPEFVAEHGLGLAIQLLPKFIRGQSAVPVTQKEKSKQRSSLEVLLEQQKALTAQIHEAAYARQRELTLAIEQARADVVIAERRVVEAEAELVAHNQEYADLLVIGTSSDSETPMP